MDELEQLRAQINEIDAEMTRLFVRRMDSAAQIASCKQARGLPIRDPAREAELLARNEALLGDAALRPYYIAFEQNVLRLSRARQEALAAMDHPGAQRLDLLLPDGVCPIRLRSGLLSEAGRLFRLDRRVLVVTDDGVPQQYAAAVAARCSRPTLVTLPQGEGSKCLMRYEHLLLRMQEDGFTRSDCVVAVGGGMICDLAGFVASTYLRGVDFYSVPTTLLAQLDAAVGGKNGCDLGGVKNQLGTIRQPCAVLIDPDLLQTLPPRQLTNGLAEAVKIAMVADPALFALLEKSDPTAALSEIISRALACKLRVVAQDERESGLRKILNFGHTVGHGLEAVTGLLHGECVALGMLPMCGDGARARLLPVLERLGLPTAVSADPDAVFTAIEKDKKRRGGIIDAVLVDDVGCCRIEPMPLAALRDRLALLFKERKKP